MGYLLVFYIFWIKVKLRKLIDFYVMIFIVLIFCLSEYVILNNVEKF